jgi:2,3-bisphosphoglycerate-independent phosphoglycerate mutase
LDGAADDKIPELGGLTPLESFEKKFIDHIASQGEFGWTEGKQYTHLFLLEFLTGKPLNLPRGLVEAVGMGVPVEENQVAYRFSPAFVSDSGIDWAYRVDRDMHARLQDCMIRNMDKLGDLNPRLYFYEDGRGVITVDTDKVLEFPSPPAPVHQKLSKMGEFEKFINSMAKEMDGLTAIPWGGGSTKMVGRNRPVPSARNMVVVSKSPSALGVGGLLNIHREVVDNMWTGFQESFRMLRSGNVFMHVEETDDISHRRAPEEKVSLLQEVDNVLMENIDQLIGYRVAFIIDHGTSSISGQHLRMNVPYAVAEVTEPVKPTKRFCERDAKSFRPLGDLFNTLVG